MSAFAELWTALEREPPPTRFRHLCVMDFGQFRERVESDEWKFANEVTASLYAGDIWLLSRAFTPALMSWMKRGSVEFMRGQPSSFHKMLEGSPDFHRMIDLESGKKYSFAGCKHSAYFYRWNSDPLKIWRAVTDRWSVVKRVMGLRHDEYEQNTPKDGVVDRIQIVRYPPAIGYLEPHSDPHLHQRLFLSGYMSKRGQDYIGGGFYAVDDKDRPIFLEDKIDVGDVCIGYATVYHGVAPCDRHKKPDWGADDGRWFLSMYSNASDEMPDRHTGHPVKLDIPDVLP